MYHLSLTNTMEEAHSLLDSFNDATLLHLFQLLNAIIVSLCQPIRCKSDRK